MSDVMTSVPAGPGELVMATRAARRYYFDDRSKIQIASELGISRFKVARLLDLARASGIVSINITGPGSLDVHLSDRLRERFGLRHAVVINTSRGDDSSMRQQLGQVAANLISEIDPDRRPGLGWARVVLAMADNCTRSRPSRWSSSPVRHPTNVEASSIELVQDVARRAGADSIHLLPPMIVQRRRDRRSPLPTGSSD